MIDRPSFERAPRWAIDPGDLRNRLSDRMLARLPETIRRNGDRVLALPRGHRARRLLLTRALIAGWAAVDSNDWDYLERLYSPGIVTVVGLGELAFDVDGTYREWPQMMRLMSSYNELTAERNWRPAEAIDLGGRFFGGRVALTATGRVSGLELAGEQVHLYEVDGGRIRRQWMFEEQAAAEVALAARLDELGFEPAGLSS